MKTSFAQPSDNYNIILTKKELDLLTRGKILHLRTDKEPLSFYKPNGDKTRINGHHLWMTEDGQLEALRIQFLTISVQTDYITTKETKMEDYKMEDYIIRMVKEYQELKGKYNKLHKMIVKYDANTLGFEPKCPIDLLRKQKATMGQYLNILEIRAEIEGFDLSQEV